MPTHQGQSQTDIILNDGGDKLTEDTNFDFSMTYSQLGDLQVKDLAPNTDRQYMAYDFSVRDATGATVARFAARYKAWVDRGSASGRKNITIDNTFTPVPDGAAPTWPTMPETTADRVWKVDTFDDTGNLFGTAQASWQVRTTVERGARVIQTVIDQDASLLRVHLVYLLGDVVLLDVVVAMEGTVAVRGTVTADPPDVTDRFTP